MRIASQGPSVVWVQGESGIGKTRLVRHALGEGPVRRVLWASGEQGEMSLRFGIVDQLWRDLREPRAGGPGSPLTQTTVDPLVMGANLLTALGSVDEPTVLLVDDLHWIDLESARSLLFLLRRLRSEPLAVVLVGQLEPVVRLGPGWLRLLADGEAVSRLDLPGLTPEELVELATAMGEPGLNLPLARRLHAHTRGHPLHARAVLEEQGVVSLRRARQVLPAPRSLAAVVTAKVDGLPAPAQVLVGAGAVLGPSFALEVAAKVGGVEDPVEALEMAIDAGLLDERADGTIAFVHPLVRAATYGSTSPQQRCALHAKAATVTSGATSLHHRVGAASGSDGALAAQLADRAATDAAAGLHARAADHLEAASRLAEDISERDRLLFTAAEMVHAGGDFVRLEAMRPQVEDSREGVHQTFVSGLMAFAANDPTGAEALLARAVDDAGDGAPWVARAAATLALTRLQLTDWDGAHRAAEAALAGDVAWDRAVAQFALVLSLAHLGRVDEARRRIADASPPGSGHDPGSLDELAALGMADILDGDLLAAEEHLQAVARRARAGEPIHLHELALANLAEVEHRLGRADEAVFHADLAVVLATESARPSALVHAHVTAALISAAAGRSSDAEDHIRAAEAVPRRGESRLARLEVAMARASLADLRRDPAAVLAALGAPFGGEVQAGMAEVGPPRWRTLLVEGLVGVGREDDAAVAHTHLTELQAARRHPTRADVARLGGLIAQAQGHEDQALATLEEGLVIDDPVMAVTPAQARLQLTLGTLLARLDRRREAMEHLRAARVTFARLGAVPFLAACDEELARCGLPVRSDVDDPLRLTDAEIRVARLVADGRSNREAASQLYVSPKTIEFHLANVYSKLGITSRRDLRGRLGPRDA